jgi:Ca2+-binding EF-hand superfamily protein
LALAVAGCSSTSDQPRRHQQEQWHPAVAIVEKYADKNGVVTRAAMEAGLKADFDHIDVNHDGCLNEDEVRAENQRRWQLDASTYSPLIDFKHTGCVDFQEYAETARSLFDQLDRNGDGKLTPNEMHPGAAKPKDKPTEPDSGPGHHRGGGNPPGGQ